MVDDVQEESPEMLQSLPDRPLKMDEADVLAESDADIAPLSILFAEELGASVYSLMIGSRSTDTVWIVGYSEDRGGWEQVETWDADEWDIEKQEDAIQAWIHENYGDRVDDQGLFNTETGDVTLGYDEEG